MWVVDDPESYFKDCSELFWADSRVAQVDARMSWNVTNVAEMLRGLIVAMECVTRTLGSEIGQGFSGL